MVFRRFHIIIVSITVVVVYTCSWMIAELQMISLLIVFLSPNKIVYTFVTESDETEKTKREIQKREKKLNSCFQTFSQIGYTVVSFYLHVHG